MQFNTSVLTNGKKYDLDQVAGTINKMASKAADYIVGLDPEIDFSDAQESITRDSLEHLVGRIRSLPKVSTVFGWGEMPTELSIVVDVKEIDPRKYDLTITESRGKTDKWSLEIQEFTGGSVEYIALRKLMKEYGFKNPTTPLRKYRVMLMGKEASLTGPELCRFEKDLIASGSLARPLFEPISEEAIVQTGPPRL